MSVPMTHARSLPGGLLLALGLLSTPASALDVATATQLRARASDEAVIYLSGRAAPGDGGQGMFVRSEVACRDDGILHIVDQAGHCFVRDTPPGMVNVRWAGARGDGKADDTEALLAAHRLFARLAGELSAAVLIYPPGSYTTRETLELPNQGNGWEVRGEGLPTIIGTADNFPIFRAVADYSIRNFRIANLRMIYKTPQPPENTRSVAIALGCHNDSKAGLLDFRIENMVFDYAWRAIAVDPDTFAYFGPSCPIWGFTIEGVTTYLHMSGASIYLATRRGGSPRGNILNFYAQNKGAVEPAITVKNMTSLYIRNAEFNLGTNTTMVLSNRQNLLESIRFEQMSLEKPSEALIVMYSGQYTVSNLEVQSFTGRSPSTFYFLRPFHASLILQNLYTWGDLSANGARFLPIDSQNAGDVEFRGTWWRHKDKGVHFDYPRPIIGTSQ